MTEEQDEGPILSRLKPSPGSTHRRARKGRGPGSGLGKTCGKGQKGQKSRAGGKVPVWFEGGQTPLQRRLPKVGFKNPFSKEFSIVNVQSLGRFDAGSVVDPAALSAAGLVGKRPGAVKILGQGELDRALTVKAHKFSARAKEMIEKAGGTAEVLENAGSADAQPGA
ncbi:MAG: 50S ribosomal protein L15 [Myxococcales bacterium]|nr:50S ribosomal protein L15 [Myxococcales bacterium]MDD9966082.1 50S ribosomal protein L15 [Myxococcales bacterium]